MKKKLWHFSTEVEASGLSPPNSQSIPPKSSSCLLMKSFFNSLYTIRSPRRSSKPSPMLLIWRWICFYPARPENTEENQPITNLKPRTFANTTVTSFAFLLKFIRCKRNDLTTTKLRLFCRLQISLTTPNSSFDRCQRELSTGLQLQQIDQNHTAISHCCLTRSQVRAKGSVIPQFWTANIQMLSKLAMTGDRVKSLIQSTKL